MDTAKVTISIDAGLLREIDSLVQDRIFSNRGQAIRTAVREGVARLDPRAGRTRREKSKVGPANIPQPVFEQRKWPEF